MNGHKNKQKSAVLEREKTESPEKKKQPASSSSQHKGRRKLIFIVLAVTGAIAAAIFGYRWWRYASTHADTDDATLMAISAPSA